MYPTPNPIPFNGMADVPPGNVNVRPGQDYPMPHGQYYGPHGNMRPGCSPGYPAMQKSGGAGPNAAGGRPGWGPMPSGQPRYMMPSAPPGAGSTPTLNQLLQSPTPEGWHPNPDFSMQQQQQQQQRMMSDDSGQIGYGGNQPGWQRMGQGNPPYLPQQHQPNIQV